AALLVIAGVLFGQAMDGILVGTVTDTSGSAIPNATVSATNRETNVKYTTVTNATGDYRLNNVTVGRYNISATTSGFTPITKADVLMELNHTTAVNLTLAVGAVTTVVEVQEAGATIDTSTAQLQSTFDARTAEDAPLAANSKVVNGAGIYNLSLLGAG